jgi:hypothetical protein
MGEYGREHRRHALPYHTSLRALFNLSQMSSVISSRQTNIFKRRFILKSTHDFYHGQDPRYGLELCRELFSQVFNRKWFPIGEFL